jgi:hypothetical protein
VATLGAPPQTGTRLGTLSLLAGQGLSPERLGGGCCILFYVVADKVRVHMQLHSLVGKLAHFGVNRGLIVQ